MMPRAKDLVRGTAELIQVEASTSNDLFTLSAGSSTDPVLVSSTLARINKRYFLVYSINVINSDGDTTTTVTLNARPDARSQVYHEFSFTDDNSVAGTGIMTGNVNWNTGVFIFSVVYSAGTFSTEYATCKVVFSAKSGEVGRVKVEMRTKG